MEISIHLQRPLNCGTLFGDRGCVKFKPFTGFFPIGKTSAAHQCLVRRKECTAVWGPYCINSRADFSRRRLRRISTARSRGPPPKGFMPRSPLGTSNQKRGHKKTGVKGDSYTPTASEISGDDKRAVDVTIKPEEEGAVIFSQEKRPEVDRRDESDGEASELSPLHDTLDVAKTEKGITSIIEEDVLEPQKEETSEVRDIDNVQDLESKSLIYEEIDETTRGTDVDTDDKMTEEASPPKLEMEASLLKQKEHAQKIELEMESRLKQDEASKSLNLEMEENLHKIDEASRLLQLEIEENLRKQEEATRLFKQEMEEKLRKAEEAARQMKLEMEAKLQKEEIEENLRKQEEAARLLKQEMDEKLRKAEEAARQMKLEMEAKLRKEEIEKNLRKQEEAARLLKQEVVEKLRKEEEAAQQMKLEMEAKLRKEEIEENLRKQEEAARLLKQEVDEKLRKEEDAARQMKLEMEAKLRKEEIERTAEVNFSRGNKLFVYPSVVKADQDIEVFLNRSLSTLSNEPDILIMGAFNDWRWKSFNQRLNKAHLKGDWWSCHLNVPREAYKVDFVFFNGKNVYDNNDGKDFSISVDGEMDELSFEDFLLEKKRKELEDLAKEQAEKERQAEEQRKIEEEKAAKEADRLQARVETERLREAFQQLINKAERSMDNVWYIEPSEFKGMDLIRLYYNRSSGPLSQANEVWIHGGHNNWKAGISFAEQLVRSDSKDGDWWHADVAVPDQAFLLDWVFANGPPQKASVYDNNHRQDFHSIVPNAMPNEQHWTEEEQLIYQKLQEERRLRQEAIRAKDERTARMKAETKEKTLKRFLLSQKHVVYTEPLDVQAGSTVTVYYNPTNTNLNGKPEVWFRCSFNRWTHRKGPLSPVRMLPAENGTHLKTFVKVPLDAYMMDFVFSEREDGGQFDNKFGMDYHIPVFGGIAKEPPMHIVHIAVEMAPIAKVGGLGDVVTSLSRAVQELNHNVDIILPKYDCLNVNHVKDLQYLKNYFWGGTEIKVWHGKVEGLSVHFLDPQNGFFWAGCVYGRGNDGERFGFFCHAALEFLHQYGFHPDIIHCHDWSSAPIAWLFKDHYMQYGLSKARVIFTIHNLEFGAALIGKAMAYADKATTVSPTYSREVAGHSAVAPHLQKFHGVLNGIDLDIWDPYNDKFLPLPYTSENVVEGKRAAKEALQQKLGIKRADLPLVGIITRLTHQKGIHLIKHAIRRTLERGGQVVLLGSAPDPRIQNDFVNLANDLLSSHHERARLCLTYDEPLSHLIYAGADFILVPSIFEPCGLTQLTAMRYGSIPVVRKTGGLYDTVLDVDHDKERAQTQGLEPNGFSFDGSDAGAVDYALNRAISAWYQGRDWFNALCKTVMEQDWSWNRPALDYLELYHAARKSV